MPPASSGSQPTTRYSGPMDDDAHLGPYRAVVVRVTDMAVAAGPALDATVPACPDWTARQLVAHMAGLAEDWATGNLDDYGSDAWAGSQVSRFDGRPLEDVLGAWSAATAHFPGLRSPLGGTPAMWAFGDAVVHEADLRPVLAPGTQVPEDAMALGLKAAIARWRSELGAADVPPLDIIASDLRTWRVGDADADANTVATTGHELFRALFGRRSRAQVERWAWSDDPAAYLDVGLPHPFSWAGTEIAD